VAAVSLDKHALRVREIASRQKTIECVESTSDQLATKTGSLSMWMASDFIPFGE